MLSRSTYMSCFYCYAGSSALGQPFLCIAPDCAKSWGSRSFLKHLHWRKKQSVTLSLLGTLTCNYNGTESLIKMLKFHHLGEEALLEENPEEIFGMDMESWVVEKLFLPDPSSRLDHDSFDVGHSSKNERIGCCGSCFTVLGESMSLLKKQCWGCCFDSITGSNGLGKLPNSWESFFRLAFEWSCDGIKRHMLSVLEPVPPSPLTLVEATGMKLWSSTSGAIPYLCSISWNWILCHLHQMQDQQYTISDIFTEQ